MTSLDASPGAPDVLFDGTSAVTYVVLAKAPVPGLAKTRLTSTYSPYEAAALAAAALLDTLDAVEAAVAPAGAPPVCAFTGQLDDAAAPDAIRAALDRFTVVEQRGGLLGERIAYAHLDAAGPDGATVQIGMDTPQVSATLLADAAARVVAPDGPDAVLGLAEDGGWWLLALRRAADARLVADVPMSTVDTGRLTWEALEAGGLTVEQAPTLIDVDEPIHVAIVAAQATGSRFATLASTLGARTEVP